MQESKAASPISEARRDNANLWEIYGCFL